MKISKYFSDEETKVSDTALRKGIDNTPPAVILPNIERTAGYMDQIRDLLGHPITVLSWYRCPKLNTAIGGSATSAHVQGYAVDFICPGYGSPLDVCRAIQAAHLPYDQLIHEFRGWVHIGYREH